jgi:hypothetical protein
MGFLLVSGPAPVLQTAGCRPDPVLEKKGKKGAVLAFFKKKEKKGAMLAFFLKCPCLTPFPAFPVPK